MAALRDGFAVWRDTVIGRSTSCRGPTPDARANVAIRVNNLGSVLEGLGDLDGARTAYERALAILEQFFAPEHPNIRVVTRNLEALKRKGQ